MSARRRRTCGCGKKTFGSRAKALGAAGLIRRLPHAPQESVPVRAYPCPHGHGWHLTSTDGDRAVIYERFHHERVAS